MIEAPTNARSLQKLPGRTQADGGGARQGATPVAGRTPGAGGARGERGMGYQRCLQQAGGDAAAQERAVLPDADAE